MGRTGKGNAALPASLVEAAMRASSNKVNEEASSISAAIGGEDEPKTGESMTEEVAAATREEKQS